MSIENRAESSIHDYNINLNPDDPDDVLIRSYLGPYIILEAPCRYHEPTQVRNQKKSSSSSSSSSSLPSLRAL